MNDQDVFPLAEISLHVHRGEEIINEAENFCLSDDCLCIIASTLDYVGDKIYGVIQRDISKLTKEGKLKSASIIAKYNKKLKSFKDLDRFSKHDSEFFRERVLELVNSAHDITN